MPITLGRLRRLAVAYSLSRPPRDRIYKRELQAELDRLHAF